MAWAIIEYDTISLMFEIKINNTTVCENADKIAAYANFRNAVRRADLSSDNIVCLFDDGKMIECHSVGDVDAEIGEKITPNNVLLHFMHSNNLSVADLKKAATKSGLVVSNSKIGGWISNPENRKYQKMQMDELMLILACLLSSGYTPENYKLLVKSTGLSNVDFMQKFNVSESTFYANIAEISNDRHRSMSYKSWLKLCKKVEKFNTPLTKGTV